MRSNLKQLSLADIYTNIDEYFQQDKPKLVRLFDQYIGLSKLIPQSFVNHYYDSTGYPSALVLNIKVLFLNRLSTIY